MAIHVSVTIFAEPRSVIPATGGNDFLPLAEMTPRARGDPMCWEYLIRVLPPIKANKYSKNLGGIHAVHGFPVREDDVAKVNEIIPDSGSRTRGSKLHASRRSSRKLGPRVREDDGFRVNDIISGGRL